MKTIIFDIDGTFTNMWPIEKSVLLKMINKSLEKDIEKLRQSGICDTYEIFLKISKQELSKKKYVMLYNKDFSTLLKNKKLPQLEKYSTVDWILKNKNRYRFVYATGGQAKETKFVLKQLGLINYFDIENSIDKSNCRFSKKSGIPFRKIKAKFNDCLLITDSLMDCCKAGNIKIPCILIADPEAKSFVPPNELL